VNIEPAVFFHLLFNWLFLHFFHGPPKKSAQILSMSKRPLFKDYLLSSSKPRSLACRRVQGPSAPKTKDENFAGQAQAWGAHNHKQIVESRLVFNGRISRVEGGSAKRWEKKNYAMIVEKLLILLLFFADRLLVLRFVSSVTTNDYIHQLTGPRVGGSCDGEDIHHQAVR
jgi:hypothetical protein